jgi:hypothetical protein
MRRRAQHIVALALLLVLAAAGWAVAATSGSAGVIHACAAARGGALRLAANCRKHERAIAWNVQGVPGKDGINGTNGSNGSPGATGTPGTARAYGLVAANGTLTRAKNATVTHLSDSATYCVTLPPGIDARTTGIIATPDFGDDTTQPGGGPDNSAHVEFNSGGSCPGNSLSVQTFKVNNANSGGDHYDVEFADEAFFFVVP